MPRIGQAQLPIPSTFPPSGPAGGDLIGTYPDPTIRSVSNPIPKLPFDTSYTPTGSEPVGSAYWNSTDGTLDLVQSGATQQIGQEMFIKVRNVSGSTIPNGSPVYVSGRTGNRPNIYLARSDSESTATIIGLTTEDIASPADGFVTTFGYVRQIKTNYSGSGNWGTTWVTGDKLYISKTVAGQLTNVEPSVPHHSDVVGTVEVVGAAGIGSIFVGILRHHTMDEMSDVDGTPLTTTGQILAWNQSAGYWDANHNIVNAETLVDTKANIQATTPTSGRTAFSTDTKKFYIADGTSWHESDLTMEVRASTPNMGYDQNDSANGYYSDAIVSKRLSNIQLGSNSGMTSDGQMRVVTNSDGTKSFQMYLNSAINDVVMGFVFKQTSAHTYLIEFKPTGLTYYYDITSGNSDNLDIAGNPVIRQFVCDMGAYSSDLIINGGTF